MSKWAALCTLPVNGNLFLRYPICAWNLAPYVMVGGGAGWDGNVVGYGSVGPAGMGLLPGKGLVPEGKPLAEPLQGRAGGGRIFP